MKRSHIPVDGSSEEGWYLWYVLMAYQRNWDIAERSGVEEAIETRRTLILPHGPAVRGNAGGS